MISVFVFNNNKSEIKKKKKHPVENNPMVVFTYPSKTFGGNCINRYVRVISCNSKYLIGLDTEDKNRFKKFLVSKAGTIRLVEFNSSSMS